MNAQIGQTEKIQRPFIVYEHVLIIGGGEVNKLTKNAGKSGL